MCADIDQRRSIDKIHIQWFVFFGCSFKCSYTVANSLTGSHALTGFLCLFFQMLLHCHEVLDCSQSLLNHPGDVWCTKASDRIPTFCCQEAAVVLAVVLVVALCDIIEC